jgi:hypothetical protein
MSDELSLDPILVEDEIVFVNKDGNLYRRILKANKYYDEGLQKIVTKPDSTGYIRPTINGTRVKLHRVIAAAYLGLDLANTKCQVDHINRIKTDNRLINLRLVTHQQNQFNRSAKGYGWDKLANKWKAQIKLNGKSKTIGYYVEEEDARSSYLAAKEELHIIVKY